jgi:hypothetical protein
MQFRKKLTTFQRCLLAVTALMMEAESTPETLVNLYEFAGRSISEHSHIEGPICGCNYRHCVNRKQRHFKRRLKQVTGIWLLKFNIT